MSVLKGKAYWASITSPNTTFDSDGVWTVDVGNLDEKNKKIAQADGLNIKNKGDDRGDFVTIKRKVKNKRGDLNKAPEVVDAQKRAMINTLIGNGSEVNVLYSTYDWEFGGKSGVSADLRAVQVTNLIPYNADADADNAFDAATCIGCGACVATCKNSSAMLFVGAKISQYSLLPQGKTEASRRVLNMVNQMDLEGFGNCSNTGACEVECPKGISLDNIARMNRELLKASLKK